MNRFRTVRPSTRSRCAVGFTLTEFAVVFVIVIVAALILMPMYVRYREMSGGGRLKAIQSVCASNEKQLSLGMLMYAQDWDEQFPRAGGVESVGGKPEPIGWGVTQTATGGVRGGLIFPYVKTTGTFRCPAGPKGAVLSYRYNDLVADARIADLTAPAQTLLLMDGEDLSFNAGHARQAGTAPATNATINAKGRVDAGKGAPVLDATTRRHKGGANYAFTDGHVKWLRPEGVFFPPQASASRASVDAKTKTPTGPAPGGAMTFGGKTYQATFHMR